MAQQAKRTKAEDGPRRPFKEVRLGLLKAVIWENPTRNGSMFSCQITRSYRDDQGQWAETHSLTRDDLLVATELLRTAFTTIWGEEQARQDRQREQLAEAA